MTKKSTTAAYTQLRDCYKQYAAAQLQALITAHIQLRMISSEKEEKYRRMWRSMLVEYKRKQTYEGLPQKRKRR